MVGEQFTQSTWKPWGLQCPQKGSNKVKQNKTSRVFAQEEKKTEKQRYGALDPLLQFLHAAHSLVLVNQETSTVEGRLVQARTLIICLLSSPFAEVHTVFYLFPLFGKEMSSFHPPCRAHSEPFHYKNLNLLVIIPNMLVCVCQ